MLISYKSLLIAVVAVSFAATSPQIDISLDLQADDDVLDIAATCNANGNDDGRLCTLSGNANVNHGVCDDETCLECHTTTNPCPSTQNIARTCFTPADPNGLFPLTNYCLRSCNPASCPSNYVCGNASGHGNVCYVNDDGNNGQCNGNSRFSRPCIKTVAGVKLAGVCTGGLGVNGFCKVCDNSACPGSTTCVNGQCVPPPSSTTSSTPPGSSTTSTTPTTTSTPCNPYYDKCPAGQYCHKGSETCKPGCKRKGSTCTKNDKTGKCRDNHTCDVSGKQKGSKCSTKKNNDCGSGLKCVAKYGHNGRCHPLAGANKSCGKGTYYPVCSKGYKCKSHKCKKSY